MTVMNSTDSWIRCFHSAPEAAVRLVCFPHAGGAASFYFPMSKALHPDIEVYSVQYPGRQDRRGETALTAVPDIARHAARALRELPRGPLALFGHSMGAAVAYETARILERSGDGPLEALFVSGRRAPSRFRPEFVHQRDDTGLVEEMRTLGGTDPGVLRNRELLQLVLPVVRNDYRAIETYRPEPGPVLDSPVTVFIGDSDPKVTLDDAQAWREHTAGEFDLEVFRGGHFYLVEHQREVLQRISGRLKAHA
jgi:surfactin synthase thioesterase subunit